MSAQGKVLVAMSGGVDSSVAAVLLAQQGFEVVGITMKTWDYASSGGHTGKQIGCCTLESMNDARAVALKHGFTHFIIDIREEFGDWVIDRFTSEYMAGRTPNPCVLCNTHIKWAALMQRADSLGCDFIATGHYARVRKDADSGRSVLMKGVDRNKDQSYAMWGVAQEHLARTIFPLGSFSKPEIRQLAADFGLDHVANKPDSYEICFVPDNDYRRFLRDRVEGVDDRVGDGDFVTSDGTVVGRHRGYPFYTIGQRHGLGLALGHPVYVTRIDPERNLITVGSRDELFECGLVARQVNFGKSPEFTDEMPATAKIRYNDEGAPCIVEQAGPDEIRVLFADPRRAITPGQAVVVYDGDDVLCGAWIHEVLDHSSIRETTASRSHLASA
ncbi:MAG: tRNA 2-thiouridine(34) synthase MnmA [Rhodothermia bacterium]|nr:tRNA 2-thiouridine(34) synthase MnmA [Rhodothermia bacterium]